MVCGLGRMASFANRRPLTAQVYPRLDTAVAGASAVVNAMVGRSKGATIFGDTSALPPLIVRSEIRLVSRKNRNSELLQTIRTRLSKLPKNVDGAGYVLADILEIISVKAESHRSELDATTKTVSTYEKMLAAQLDSSRGREKNSGGGTHG